MRHGGARDVIDGFRPQCQRSPGPSLPPPADAVSEWLERVRPVDFRPPSETA